MPLFTLTRFLTSLLSLLILPAAIYFLWSWRHGHWVMDTAGIVLREREPWRLWTAVGLFGWSFLGRFILPWLIAGPDPRPDAGPRDAGRRIDSLTGAALHVEAYGPAGAPPIIFVHGWGLDSSIWREARRDLADRFRVIVWDLPGLGRSKAMAAASIRLESYATDLASVIDGIGRQRPVLVGHSIGGMIIQTLLRDQPQIQDRIAGVVLLNTTCTNPLRTMVFSRLMLALQRPVLEPAMRLTVWLQLLVWLNNLQSYLSGATHLAMRFGFGRRATRRDLNQVAWLATRNAPGVQARGNLAMMRWDGQAALQALRVPALVIAGSRDIVTKPGAGRLLADQSARSRLEVVSGVNHMGLLERSETYNQLIGDFALSVQPSATRDVRPPDQTAADKDFERREPPMPPAQEPRSFG